MSEVKITQEGGARVEVIDPTKVGVSQPIVPGTIKKRPPIDFQKRQV